MGFKAHTVHSVIAQERVQHKNVINKYDAIIFYAVIVWLVGAHQMLHIEFRFASLFWKVSLSDSSIDVHTQTNVPQV